NQVDVATNNNESLSRLEKTNGSARENIETIWTSTLIPSDPIAWRSDLPENLKTKLKDFFYNFDDASVLAPLEWSGFIPAEDSTWNPIRELNIGKEILEIQSNENLSEADKNKKIAELNQQLEAIK
ncbi:MAG: PhnD/SsuA/transferrin family substrate-binding protein, partial [Cyanobacteria bacterium J06600_6]